MLLSPRYAWYEQHWSTEHIAKFSALYAGTVKHHNVCKVTLPLTMVSNKLNIPFSPMLFQ